MRKELIQATISQYSDYHSTWWGLKDGRLLPTTDSTGKMWVRVNGITMTVKEWNEGT